MPARGFRSLSLPSLGSFRLSLTVLCAIGHRLVFSLGGWAPRLRPGFHVPWATREQASRARRPLKGCHLLGRRFPAGFEGGLARLRLPTPRKARFGLLPVRSPLLGESRLISSPPGTWMFRFPGFAFLQRNPRQMPGGFSHSEPPGSRAGAPRQGVSPLPASFIAGRCLGIPRVRYVVASHLMLADEASHADLCSILFL
jgi:hypothetical protein